MEYYINPMWFYLQSISNGVKITSICMIVVVVFITFFVVWYKVDEDDATENIEKCIKRGIIGASIFTILAIAIPSTDTINKMIVSSVVTKENVAKGVETTKDLIDYIVDKINEIEWGIKNGRKNNWAS